MMKQPLANPCFPKYKSSLLSCCFNFKTTLNSRPGYTPPQPSPRPYSLAALFGQGRQLKRIQVQQAVIFTKDFLIWHFSILDFCIITSLFGNLSSPSEMTPSEMTPSVMTTNYVPLIKVLILNFTMQQSCHVHLEKVPILINLHILTKLFELFIKTTLYSCLRNHVPLPRTTKKGDFCHFNFGFY